MYGLPLSQSDQRMLSLFQSIYSNSFSLSIFLSPCKNKVFRYVFFPDIHDNTHGKTYGSLRTAAKQFSVNIKDLGDISFISSGQYAAFDHPTKTNVMIINQEK